MISSEAPIVARMQSLIHQWEETSNPQAVFLSCYKMMTSNMLTSIERQEFMDPPWVTNLLHRFADHYFVALESYEKEPTSAPRVWQLAHDTTRDPQVLPLQNLLLGINAHINYDLVITLVDLLSPEWNDHSDEQRASRYYDFCHVNDVIVRTIDVVQDQVLEPAMPGMDILAKLLGSLDELLVSRLITSWREKVWHNVLSLLEATAQDEQWSLLQQIEEEAVGLGKLISLRD